MPSVFTLEGPNLANLATSVGGSTSNFNFPPTTFSPHPLQDSAAPSPTTKLWLLLGGIIIVGVIGWREYCAGFFDWREDRAPVTNKPLRGTHTPMWFRTTPSAGGHRVAGSR